MIRNPSRLKMQEPIADDRGPIEQLTVVLPFYNEEALLPSLPRLIERIHAVLAGRKVRVLAVDDGSTDATRGGLGELEVVAHETNRGVGAAIATGISEATGDAVLIYDPDEAYEPAALAELVAALAAADVATLSPYHPQGGVEGVGPVRRFLSRQASRMYRRRLRSDLHTYTCAVRAYRLPQARELLPAPEDFTASAFLLAKALRKGMRVVEVPAVLRVRRRGSSKMRLFRAILSHLRLLRDLSVTAERNKPAS